MATTGVRFGHRRYDPARTLLVDDNILASEAADHAGIGHLIGVAQPDSGEHRRTDLPYPSCNRFAEIMP